MIQELMKEWFSLTAAQRMFKAREKQRKLSKDISNLDKKITLTENTNLQDIKWIWPSTIQKLLENWIKSKEELKAIEPERIKEIIKSPIALKAINNI